MTIREKLTELQKEVELLDLTNYYREGDTIEQYLERLEESIYEIEVIYYGSAIEYLRESDPSFKAPLELAADLGYRLEDLNSEKLATILKQDDARIELEEIRGEIEDIFNS